MGQSGSYTVKASPNVLFFSFTKWNNKEIDRLREKGLKDQFSLHALQKRELATLIGVGTYKNEFLDRLFDFFSSKKNVRTVDKFEVMSTIIFVSVLSNVEKIYALFDIFNFHEKGYLLAAELSLMFLSITNGLAKVDTVFAKPTHTYLKNLLRDALACFAESQPNLAIRKPELVRFVTETSDVLAYFNSWADNASQVLLIPGERWCDYEFPATITSIYPSTEWRNRGHPPSDFVSWRSLPNLKRTGSRLFTHDIIYLRRSDKLVLFDGPGCLADGFLIQGLLADKWILNALCMCIAAPLLVSQLFATTGQERDGGRFCVRLFSDVAWKSVFIDDRLPCDVSAEPLFLKSSDELEMWPSLLEKAMAKLAGSYGRLADCSDRIDSVESALYSLTGGHPKRFFTKEFFWSDITDEVSISPSPPSPHHGEKNAHGDGFAFVVSILKEGSLVAFGVSEASCYHKDHLRQSARTGIPFGCLFPLVGTKAVDGFNYLVFKDTWGLVVKANNVGSSFDPFSGEKIVPGAEEAPGRVFELRRQSVLATGGHARTFQIKMDTIADIFDTFYTCRFPDSLRFSRPPTASFKRWKTDILVGTQDLSVFDDPSPSEAPGKRQGEQVVKPARFFLNITGAPIPTKMKPKSSLPLPRVRSVLLEAAETETQTAALADSYAQAELLTSASVAEATMIRNKKEKAAAGIDPTLTDAPTIKSQQFLPHIDGPNEDNDGRDNVVLVDDVEKEEERNLYDRDDLEVSESLKPPAAQILDDSPVDFALSVGSMCPWTVAATAELGPRMRVTIRRRSKATGNTSSESETLDQQKPRNAEQRESDETHFNFTRASSRLVEYLQLYPGEYIIDVDLTYENADKAALVMSKRAVLEDPYNLKNTKGSKPSTSSSVSIGVPRYRDFLNKIVLQTTSTHLDFETRAVHTMRTQDRELGLRDYWKNASVQKAVPADASIFSAAVGRGRTDTNMMNKFNEQPALVRLPDIKLEPEMGCFILERQEDVSSRGVIKILSNLKEESAMAGITFVSLFKKYKRHIANMKSEDGILP